MSKTPKQQAFTQTPLFELQTPSMPTLDVSRCSVREVQTKTAAAMVKEFHYAHRVPSITVAVGLWVDGVLAGVVTYGVAANRNQDYVCGEEHKGHVLELNRLFIHDWAGTNSESYLIGQSFHVLERDHPEFYIIISYADTAHGHLGKIYQATNWIYTGESVMDVEGWRIGGKTFHPRTLSGMLGSCAADVIRAKFPDARPVRGEIKHRYVMLLGPRDQQKKLRAALKYDALPYPKTLEVLKHKRDDEGVTVVKPEDDTTIDPDEMSDLQDLVEYRSKPKKLTAAQIAKLYATKPKVCCPNAAPGDCACGSIICPKHGETHATDCTLTSKH